MRRRLSIAIALALASTAAHSAVHAAVDVTQPDSAAAMITANSVDGTQISRI